MTMDPAVSPSGSNHMIVLMPVPLEGPFQKLEEGGPTGLQTEFSPGDIDCLGARGNSPPLHSARRIADPPRPR